MAAVDCTHSPLSLCGMFCISLLYNIARCNIQQDGSIDIHCNTIYTCSKILLYNIQLMLLYALYIVCSLPIYLYMTNVMCTYRVLCEAAVGKAQDWPLT